jgi:hypothetical protein
MEFTEATLHALLLLERLDLFAQLRGLSRFVDACSGEDGERGGDDSFFEVWSWQWF